MRRLNKVDEFKREAPHALFTKQQAIFTALKLLELERDLPENSDEERRVLSAAYDRADFRYLDETDTETARMLDSFGVARITADDVARAIENLLFDVK